MTGVTSGSARAPFDFKSATLPLVALRVLNPDASTLAAELARRLDETPEFFSNDLMVIDLAAVRESDQVPDFAALVSLLREHRVRPLAVRAVISPSTAWVVRCLSCSACATSGKKRSSVQPSASCVVH